MSNGYKNFRRCQSKEIRFQQYYRRYGEDGAWSANPPTDIDDNDLDIKFLSVLECPKLEDRCLTPSGTYETKEEAYDELRNLAAQVLCQGCMYSKMKPLEVEQTRLKEAQTRAERRRLELEIARAETDLAEQRRLGFEALQAIDQMQGLPHLPISPAD